MIVQKIYPNAQQWRDMTEVQRSNFKNDIGVGFSSLARIFGIEGRIASRSPFLALGRALFGDVECLKEPDKNYFLEWFRQNPDALKTGRFGGISPTVKVNGYTLDWISTQFGIIGKPTKDPDARSALERAILKELFT